MITEPNRYLPSALSTLFLPALAPTAAFAESPVPEEAPLKPDGYGLLPAAELSHYEEVSDSSRTEPLQANSLETLVDPTFLFLAGLTIFQGVMFTSLARMFTFLGGQSMAQASLRQNTARADVFSQTVRREALSARSEESRNSLLKSARNLESYREIILKDYQEANSYHERLKSNWMYGFYNLMMQPVLEHFGRKAIILPPQNPQPTLENINRALKASGNAVS